MPRPQLTEDVLDRIADAVDERTKVSVSHLTTQQQVELLLDELQEETNRADRLARETSTTVSSVGSSDFIDR
jgi:hypothetical protein